MSSPADSFGRTYVINLPERKDRLKAISRELSALGMPFSHPKVELLAATRSLEAQGFPSKAVRGCFLSHLAILRKVQRERLKSALIMEDDLAIAPAFASECARLVQEAERVGWGFLYFGHIEPGGAPTPRLVPCAGPLVTAHFYAVNGTAVDRLVAYLEQVLSRAPGDPRGGPMHYDGALSMFREANPDIATLIAQPSLGWQRFSRSDIHGNWYDKIAVLRGAAQALRGIREKKRAAKTMAARPLGPRLSNLSDGMDESAGS